MKKLVSLLIAILYTVIGTSQELAVLDNKVPVISASKSSLVYYRPHNVFEQPEFLLGNYKLKSIPLQYYSEEELELQKVLNDKEESIATFSEGDNRFFPRRIDREDITPYTWKWVHLQVKEEDGSYTNVHLRRPNWWFVENNATKVGDDVHIMIPQIGLDEQVSVVKIYPNQLDTRLWDNTEKDGVIYRPITGKIEHYVNNVVDLHFEESSKPLSVTTNHLLWSYSRNDWTKVGDLAEGEKITTKDGLVTVKERIKKEGWYVVYDLEVYRDHNFLVGSQNVLAHNGCDDVKKLGKQGQLDKHGTLKKVKGGGQSHHLNQDAAFRDIIPTDDGMAIKLEGNAFKDINTPHYNAHKSLEAFWDQYRKGGSKFMQKPTIIEYSQALKKSLQDAGLSKDQVDKAVRAAVKNRIEHGLIGGQKVPRIPGRINQKKG